MSFIKDLNKFKRLPLNILLNKLISKALKAFIPSRFLLNFKRTNLSLSRHLTNRLYSLPDIGNLNNYKLEIIKKADQVLEHRFDLLGSGLTKVEHGCICNGFQGRLYNMKIYYKDKKEFIENNVNVSNRSQSLKIISLIPDNYVLIDWQLDFKTCFRWLEGTPSSKLKYGLHKGVDVKTPWELGRMQHLPLLAYAYAVTCNEKYKYEFKNELIDFIASNPVGYGIQWKNAMESSIRCANITLALDLFDFDKEIDYQFIDIIENSIKEHINFIINNLEWSSGMRGNHYFSSICSLIILFARFEANEKVIKQMTRYVNILQREIYYQFNEDGGNFEASTYYHLFTTEMLLNALIVLTMLDVQYLKKLSIEKTKDIIFKEDKLILKEKLHKRLQSIIDFTNSIIDKDGKVPQIGDNDSGEFYKTGNEKLPIKVKQLIDIFADNKFIPELNIYKNRKVAFKPQLITYNEKNSFKQFGLYILQNDDYKLYIRKGDTGQKGKGGHAHNDQLSITLNYKGKEIIVDPGAFVYTPDIEYRNLFRSTSMHNLLIPDGIEQFPLGETFEDLFWLGLKHQEPPEVFIDNKFVGSFELYPKKYTRTIQAIDNVITGKEEYRDNKMKRIKFHLHPNILIIERKAKEVKLKIDNITISLTTDSGNIDVEDYNYSRAYGLIEAAKCIMISSYEEEINWSIRF